MNQLTYMSNRRREIATASTAVVGTALSIYVASSLTCVVIGATAAPGAISSAPIIINGSAMVISKVAACAGVKIFAGFMFLTATLFIVGFIYTSIQNPKK